MPHWAPDGRSPRLLRPSHGHPSAPPAAAAAAPAAAAAAPAAAVRQPAAPAPAQVGIRGRKGSLLRIKTAVEPTPEEEGHVSLTAVASPGPSESADAASRGATEAPRPAEPQPPPTAVAVTLPDDELSEPEF